MEGFGPQVLKFSKTVAAVNKFEFNIGCMNPHSRKKFQALYSGASDSIISILSSKGGPPNLKLH